jgi:hypothetical protein
MTLKEKVQKKFPTFADAVDGLGSQDLEKQLLHYSKSREEVLCAQREDKQLEDAKEQVKELNAPYSESLGDLKIKTAYLALLLKEKNG